MYADRVKDTTTAPGTGTITLANVAPAGYQTFATAFTTGTLVSYCIADQSGTRWEVGTGTFTAPATLTRTTVLASSAAGAKVDFATGTQDVFCTAPAKYLDTFTSTNQGTVPASGGGTSNFLRADGNFAAPPATAPASPTTSVQFNNAGAFGGVSTFTYASGTDTLSVGKLVSANFTSAAQGLVPASGGGTANFLRADGSFAAPAATAPAGATTQIQYSNGTAFAASSTFTYTVGTTTLTVPTINATKITTNNGTSASGTNLLVQPGTGSGAGNFGGNASFYSGGGNSGASGGLLAFYSGGGNGNGSGGDITFTAGDGYGTGVGGNFTFNAGAAQGTGTGGTLNIYGGQSISGTGGDVYLFPGVGPVANGSLILSDGNIILIQCQLIGVNSCMGFFNAAPVAQPTTATASATRAAVIGTVANIGDTYDGYTLAKVVKALRNLGILA